MDAEPLGSARLVTAPDGSSHFAHVDVTMTATDFAPPAAPLDVSEPAAASAMIHWRAPPGWDGRRHPSPARQWVIVLRGAIEVCASDGTSHRLDPGDGLLLEDVSGEGHTTRVVSGEPAVGVFVQLSE